MLSDSSGPRLSSLCSRAASAWNSLCEADLENLALATWVNRACEGEVYANLACRRLLGVVRLDEIAGQAWQDSIHIDDRADYLRGWNRFVEGKAARFSDTVRWVRPDTGQVVRLAVRAQKWAGGQIQGWIRSASAELALSRLESLSDAKGA